MSEAISFWLDGKEVIAAPDETILAAAQRAGVAIPQLCHADGLRPDGNCRACVVDIAGERTLAPSCCRRPTPEMRVETKNPRARAAQRMVLEMLRSDIPESARRADSELEQWCTRLGVAGDRLPPRAAPPADTSHPAIAVRLDACIQCTRCLRACREVQGNDVIGYARRGAHAGIVFDAADALAASSCVACGECVAACPTGALLPASGRSPAPRSVDSVCPYCGVGCQVRYQIDAGRIVAVEGRDGPANRGRLCVKGRYGLGYAGHRERLTTPLIRRTGIAKGTPVDPADPAAVFRTASWKEALDCAADGLARIRRAHGPAALAGFGSAKGSNEEAYLFQKLVRIGFGSNNVDHCTRLCHASSVAALLEGIGSGAVSNPVADVAHADCILVVGANPTVNHPVAASFIKNAARAGARLIVIDPRRTELARDAWRALHFRADSDVALLNAMMHVIVEEGLVDGEFIAARTTGFAELREHLRAYPPAAMAEVCGIPAATIAEVARAYATARNAMILWGMGVSQHVHGTDNARCLIALALMTGQIGRRGTGLHPLRGQNNVQGASDAGLIPMMLPDYQRVGDAVARARFERAWGVALDPRPGLTVTEVLAAAARGDVRGMYILGENPAMSDPDLNHARAALAALDHLVVQDIFLTETAAFADVILPASACPEKTGSFTNTDRTVQLGHAALAPPGDARQDLELIQEIARRLGLPWHYADAAAVFAEMRELMPSIAGISWQRLAAEGAVTYPCRAAGEASEVVMFGERFPTADGRARFVPAGLVSANELPDADYPFVLMTGRQLEHWHTGAMTRRAAVLDALEPNAYANLHPDDIKAAGAGRLLRIESRRGALTVAVRADAGLARGTVFMPFCYAEAAANLLTNPALDPDGKIPEFKYCAVRLRAVP